MFLPRSQKLAFRPLLASTLRGAPTQHEADHPGTLPPAQIGHYGNARIAPSADAIIRLANAFNVACDYLLVDSAPRGPFRPTENTLGDRLATIAELS